MTDTVRSVLAAGAGRLAAAGIDGASGDARRLLASAMDVEPGNVTLQLNEPMLPGAKRRFDAMLARRLERVPVSQILGKREFFGRAFYVNEDVLDPRPETETLIELALAAPFERVLDLGTGSGIIALTLVAERESAVALATDISEQALWVARQNPQLEDHGDRVEFRRSNWFASVDGQFDLIVSNPPYIPSAEIAGLAPEVREHEPRAALDGGADGLDAYRAIAAGAPAHLAPGGRLIVEIGPDQGAAVAGLFRAAGLAGVVVHPDLDGRDRAVVARNPG